MKLILEPRYLFDASIAHVAKHIIDLNHNNDFIPHCDPRADQVAPAVTAPDATCSAPHEVLFVDPRVSNWQTLVNGVKPGTEVIVLNDSQDGLAQVTAALNGQQNITAIHFLAYGQPGSMELGNSEITNATLQANASEIASWSSHLAPNADIMIWGCDVASGTNGQAFIQELHSLTGAQVAASTDATGDAALGGNWTLEASTGHIDATVPFTAAAINAYHNVLDTPLPTVTLSGVPGTVLLGNNFSETVTFSNTAANGVGYGPFIDVFAPTDAAQDAALTSATYLGQSLSVTAVTLSTTVAGHSGVLGADHPLALDNTGNPLFVQAPTGYQAGDTLYVITLPFGSYTPGEPAANVTLNFSLANTSELSSSHSNLPLNITAEGGFEYGADALNNPTTDPSIRGTGVSSSLTDSADGAVEAGTQVGLINVQATTDLPEGETATGPDYPFHYVVTLTPASATSGDAIGNFDYTFQLPGQVQYTGGAITIAGGGSATGTATFHPGSSAPGGSVTVDFTSLSATGGATTIYIPVFVPQRDANNVNILDPNTGASATIGNTSYTYSGNWNPLVGSFDHNLAPQTFSGDSSTNPSSTAFVAKSLAIQLIDSAGSSVVPGEVVTYTVNFQVSDYFDLNNLNIRSLLSDGQTLLAPGDAGYVAPTLSITREGVTTSGISFTDVTSPQSFTFSAPGGSGLSNEAVAESGSNAYWNYSRDDTGSTLNPGSTTINFAIGTLLASQFGPDVTASVLEGSGGTGATQGTITFKAKTLDWYTNNYGQNSLREHDGISADVSIPGTNGEVVTVSGGVITDTGNSVSDDSATSDSVPDGSLQLSIVAVNGIATSGTPDIHPGDDVTYAMTYTLTSGDYGNLQLSSYLPLPVFKATDPNANGSNVASYTADNVDPFPVVGQYKLVNAPAGGSIQSDSTNATSNGITFNLGTLNDTANTGGQVVVYFTVKSSTLPYADGLAITNQASSSYNSATGSVQSQAAIQQVVLDEPELVVKTGIVSVVGDDGVTPKGTYSADPTNNSNGVTWTTPQDTTPSDAFNAAETGGSPFNGVNSPLTADNLNVAGVDASDTARVVSTIKNQGHADAFDVTVKGALPAGYALSDISNFQVVDSSGNAVAYTGTVANYFSASGITLNSSIAKGSADYVVYDLTVHSTQTSGATLTASSTLVNWADYAGGVAAGAGFVSGTTPLGESANALTDDALINITTPTISKTVIAANDTSTAGSTEPVNLPSVTLGETMQYQLVLTLPEGVTSNGLSDVKIQDTLPTGVSLVSVDSITFGPGVTNTGVASSSHSGQVVTFDLGSSVTNNNPDTAGTVTILYTAIVNSSNSPVIGHNYTNDAALQYSGAPVSDGHATVNETDPNVIETISAVDTVSGNPPANNNVLSNENLTYTVTLTNTGNAPANNLVDFVKLPSGLTYVPGSLAYVMGGTGESVDDTALNTTGLKVALTALNVGQSATFTFQVTVDPNQPSNIPLTVQTPNDGTSGTYTSLPASLGGGHTYTDSGANTLTTAQYTTSLSIVGESNNTTPAPNTPDQDNTQVDAQAVVGEVVRMHATISIPEGANPTTVNFVLPSGLSYLNDGTSTIAFVSPDGTLASTNAALSGLTAYQDSNSGGANYINPATGTTTAGDAATFAPTNNLPGSVVDTSTPGHVVVNLGTLSENSNSATANYVIIEFNALVQNVTSNVNNAALATNYTVTNSALGNSTSNTATVTVDEPDVTVQKEATAVDSTTGTVTYAVTLTNTGPATAYNITLDNPAVANEQNIAFVGASGPGIVTDTTTGTDVHDVVASLASGQSEVITYTVQATNPVAPVTNDTATVTWASLPGSSVFQGSTVGADDSATGLRDFNAGSNPPDDYIHTATTGLGTLTGQVWQDLGSDQTHYNPMTDTALAGLTVTATAAGPDGILGTADDIVLTTTTAADGSYSFALLPDGPVKISLQTNGTAGGPAANETLLYDPQQNGESSDPAAARVTSINGNNNSHVDFSFQASDTPPTLGSWNSAAQTYISGATGVLLSNTGAASVADAQLDTLIAGGDTVVTDYRNTVLTIERYNGSTATPNANDVFSGDGTGATNLVLSGGNVSFNGVALGTYTMASGVLSVTFGAGVQKTDIANVLDHLTYNNTSTIAAASSITIGATLYDGNEAGGKDYQGTEPDSPHSLDNTSAPVIATLNLQPVSSDTVTFIEPNDMSAYTASVTINTGVAVSTGAYSSATVSISGNLHPAEDVLTANTTGTSLSTSYNAATGVLTITGTGTQADYQQVLRTVQYTDTSATPSTDQRSVTFAVTHGASTDTLGTSFVNVVPDNQSPILAATSGSTGSIEDATAPVGVVGSKVQDIVAGLTTDPDGPFTGIAITAAQTSFTLGSATVTGNWFYSTDNGTTWNAINVPVGSALDLKADANTRVYFQSTTPDFNGSLPNALSFLAWDGANSVSNGSVVTLPGATGTGLSSTGAAATDSSSYSSAFDTLAVTVAAVNDAPIASGQATLAAVTNSNLNPPGDTVADLFGANFSDTADQQQTAANPTGSVANTLAGVAIVGNHALPSEGMWQYSNDNGVTWTSLPVVSNTSAVVLSVSAELRFLPNANFGGTPGNLDVRVIDNSSGPVTTASGVDVSMNGGSTPISDGTVALITAVNEGNVSNRITPPDDPLGNNSGTAPGGLPYLSLQGSAGSRFIIAEQHSVVALPSDLFHDTDNNQVLTYEAKSSGDAPLPAWLRFDPQSLTFSGTPPASAYGTVNIAIEAQDGTGNKAVAEFRLHVGREQEKLMAMLKSPNGEIPLPLMLASNEHSRKGRHEQERMFAQKLSQLMPAAGHKTGMAPDYFEQSCVTSMPHVPFYISPGWMAFSDQLKSLENINNIQKGSPYFNTTPVNDNVTDPSHFSDIVPAAGNSKSINQ